MINGLGGADQVLLNISLNQQTLAKETSELSSGLRIQTAADDPSGNAIAQGLQAHVNGLQQSVENVQEGNNLLTVADGAAATVQSILQRINSLIIESNSDINSNTQLDEIQTEIDQMLLEINRIAENANFNGVHLFDGSHDTSVVAPSQQPTFTQVNPGLLADGSLPTGADVSDPQNPALTGAQQQQGLVSNAALIQNLAENITFGGGYFSGLVVFQVLSYSNNPTDPTLGVPLGQPGVIVQADLYSNSSSFSGGQGNHFEQASALPTGQGYDFNLITGSPTPGSRPANQETPSGNSLAFDMPNLSAADVGVAIAFEITTPQQSGGGSALNINDGGAEGATIALSLPSLSTNTLNVSDITVQRSTSAEGLPGAITGTAPDSSNYYAASDAENRVQFALESVAQTRAYIGAQMVSTQDDANNASIAILNYQSSESSIADLNVGTAVTQFTKNQILASVGTSVLTQMQVSAKALNDILLGTLPLGGGVNALA